MRRALDAAVAPVAQPTEGLGNPSDRPNTYRNQRLEREVAQDAQDAPAWAACRSDPVSCGGPSCACDDLAEREAIQAEPPLPPLGSAIRAERDEAQRRTIAGLLRAASWPPAPDR